ncbi:MAG: MBL fold metallo-hydrolase [Myxococcales bacterium]|nr:MBL fold metallo-hydrolase [Myxococcales bacterium]
MLFRQLFDPETSTYTYLLADEDTREAVLIDPVQEQVERDLRLVDELGLRLVHTLETHVHADHITGASKIRERLGTRSVVAAHGGASCGDVPVEDGDRVAFGRHALVVRTTPGHTDGCLSFVLDDESMVFTGDALLIRGCGRTDFQQGDAHALYRSVHDKLFRLPDHTKVYPGHDYRGHTVSTVGEERAHNPRLGGDRTEQQFVEIMAGLDLAQPKQIDVAVPANLNCGVEAKATAPAHEGGSPFVPGEVVEVDPAWVVANAEGVFLVDVRQPEEFHGELGRVGGSVLAPLGEVAQTAQGWERGKPIVTICRSGGRSLSAAHALRELGFREVASMRGGMLAWNQAGLPKVSG